MQIYAQLGAGTKKVAKGAGTKKAGTKVVKKAPSRSGVGSDDVLWLPNISRPVWLDGSLPGDNGFDPLSLGKPPEYFQMELDGNDIYAKQNKFGECIGEYKTDKPVIDTEDVLSPYDDVFNLVRFRECELIHGRWAMLACLGCIVEEATTGVSWVDAGKVELDQFSYFGFPLPFSITQLVWIEVLAVGGAEIYRNTQSDVEKRCYPGGLFDPLKLASEGDARAFRLKENEIAHCRLAMVSFFGYIIQALYFQEGALGSLARFTNSFNAGSG